MTRRFLPMTRRGFMCSMSAYAFGFTQLPIGILVQDDSAISGLFAPRAIQVFIGHGGSGGGS